MYKPGDRVIVSFCKGTVVEFDDEMRERFPNLNESRKTEFAAVKFDGPGPNRDGYGLYHVTSFFIRKLRPAEDK